MSKKKNQIDQKNYKKFLEELNKTPFDNNFDSKKAIIELQKLENSFKKKLLNSKKNISHYEKFVDFILNEEKNILRAKIYFREPEGVFFSKISKMIRDKDIKGLTAFNMNYKFISIVMQDEELSKRKDLSTIFNKIVSIRKTIMDKNMPLIINRARLYQFKSRKFSEDPVDFIQTGTEGFVSAIDKFVVKKDHNFNGYAIGWIQAVLMAEFSTSFLRLPDKGRKILYRANIAIFRHGMKDMNKVLEFVKEKYPNTTKELLDSIIISSQNPEPIQNLNENEDSVEDKIDQEESIIKNEMKKKLYSAIEKLPIINRKVIILKGGLENV